MNETAETTARPTAEPAPPRRSRRRRASRRLLGTLFRLLLACAAVGTVLTLIGVDPLDLWRWLWGAVAAGASALVANGEEALVVAGAVLATGAVVVLPIWAVRRLLGATRRRR